MDAKKRAFDSGFKRDIRFGKGTAGCGNMR